MHPRIISNAHITCVLVPVLGYLATTYTVLVSTPNECIALEDGEPQVCLLYINCLLSAVCPFMRGARMCDYWKTVSMKLILFSVTCFANVLRAVRHGAAKQLCVLSIRPAGRAPGAADSSKRN